MKQMIKDTLILFAITLIAGCLLGLFYQVTQKPIARQEELAKQEAYQKVFADADKFEVQEFDTGKAESILKNAGYDATINEVIKAINTAGEPIGYVVTVTTHEAYNGDITFSVGIKGDGTVNGMSILSISETAGLGMKAEEELVPQFSGKKTDSFAYSKTGASADNEIDAISGATITTNAVVNGVNAGLIYFQEELAGGGKDE